jgi:hypothetical protein
MKILSEEEAIPRKKARSSTMAKRKTKKKRKTYLSRDEIQAKLMRLK